MSEIPQKFEEGFNVELLQLHLLTCMIPAGAKCFTDEPECIFRRSTAPHLPDFRETLQAREEGVSFMKFRQRELGISRSRIDISPNAW